MQKHLMRLPDRCLLHVALQYLVIREREKSYALCKLEVMKGGKQRLVTLALVKKNDLLCSSQSKSKNPDYLRESIRQKQLEILALVTEIENSPKRVHLEAKLSTKKGEKKGIVTESTKPLLDSPLKKDPKQRSLPLRTR